MTKKTLNPQNELRRVIGVRVQAARKALGWTQSRLAREMTAAGWRIDPCEVSRLEQGRSAPSGYRLVGLRHALGVSVDHLLGL
jgi:transcriptional regulator with XRE-family HTH domain